MKKPLALLAVLLSFTTSSQAQTLVGTVLDASSTAPLAGVVITARDSTRRVTTRTLTDKDGKYVVRAKDGSYLVSFEYLGFAPVEHSVVLASADPARLDVRLRVAPVQLTEIVAETKGRCGSTRDPQAAKLWYLARTALGASAADNVREFRLRRYTRNLDTKLKPVGIEKSNTVTAKGWHGFAAAPARYVMQFGFVQQDEYGGLTFYGPDADLLLSDEFVDGHCFRVTLDKDNPGMVGLAFAPAPRGLAYDIDGTMWLDRNNGELKFVEFNFTGLHRDIAKRFASGRVEFERLPDGDWIVLRWYIRMPEYELVPETLGSHYDQMARGSSRIRMKNVVETGGETLAVDKR